LLRKSQMRRFSPSKHKFFGFWFLLLALLAPGALREAMAAVRTVTATADDGSAGTLRAQIVAANTGDTIDFDPAVSGTITLTNGQIVLDKQLTITGPGAGVLTISGNNTSRIFNVGRMGRVTISGLTLANGKALVEAEQHANYVYSAARGGAIINAGTLSLQRCVLTNNRTDDYQDSCGGAIYNWNGVSQVGDNWNVLKSSLLLEECTLSNNVADTHGGAIFNNGGSGTALVTVQNSVFSGNAARDTGAVNSYSANGGGIYNYAARARTSLTGCTFTSNSADGGGGALFNDGSGGSGDGKTATIDLQNCTIDGNTAGKVGGGIYNLSYGDPALISVTNCTITGNQVGGSSGAAIYNDGQGGASSSQSTIVIQLRNTIIAYNTAPQAPSHLPETVSIDSRGGYYGGGRIESLGGNLCTDYAGGVTHGNFGIVNVDPKLGPLQDNGGATATRALLTDSPALDTGTNTGVPATDQRGQPRRIDGDGNGAAVTDIGAVEMPANFSPRFSISGRVYDGQGIGIANADISLIDPATRRTTFGVRSNGAGYYSFTGLPPSSQTVSLAKYKYTFASDSRTVTITNANVGNVNFLGATGYTISGRISNSGGIQIAGATISRGTGTPVVSNSAGYYTFIGVQPGSYSLTVTKSGTRFTPPSRAVTVTNANIGGINFIGATGYNISGRIAQAGIGLVNVSVKRSGSNVAALTNGAGYYTFTDVPDGAITITPQGASFNFTPESRNVTMAGADIANQSFLAVPGYTIAGRIANSAGVGISGVTVTRSGSSTVSVTNAAGYFTFTGVANGSYTLTPSSEAYHFTPVARTAMVNGATVSGQNYIGVAR